jgi:DNA-nicking Smr family endonuclease
LVVSVEEFDPFGGESADIVPHTPVGRIRRTFARESAETLQRRRDAATDAFDGDRNPLREEGIEPLDAYAILEFKRPGVQNGVFRKLKQGRYSWDARLDLHRLTVATARREVFDFVNEAVELGLRSLIIIHGRGDASQQGRNTAVLKGYVNHWLPEIDDVQAFCSARPEHGSTGAVYVLVRKSEEKKMENRLHFNKGRVD